MAISPSKIKIFEKFQLIWVPETYCNNFSFSINGFEILMFWLLLGGGQNFERPAEIDVEAAEADIEIFIYFYV